MGYDYDFQVSIIIPVHNGENFISDSIESVLNQSFQNFELIIIDDASTDKTLNVLKNFQKRNSKINVIVNHQNVGRAVARNQGMKQAKGKYIALLDADDMMFSNKLEKQYNFLQNNPEIFLVGSSLRKMDQNKNVLGSKINPSSVKEVQKILPHKSCIIHSSVMFRNTGEYFHREKFPYAQDYDLYLLMLSDGKKLTNLKEPLIYRRIHSQGITHMRKAQQREFGEKAREFYQQRLKYGKDEYEYFDPEEILNIDPQTTTRKVFLEAEIKSRLLDQDFISARKFSQRYFFYHSIKFQVLIFYLLTYTPKKLGVFLVKKSL